LSGARTSPGRTATRGLQRGIGVARAAYYPQISLTGSGGLPKRRTHSSLQWPLRPLEFRRFPVAAHLYRGKNSFRRQIRRGAPAGSLARLSANDPAILSRRFRFPHRYKKNREFREQQELLTASAEDASRLSNIRYKGGVTSYLEVLTNETNYFSAQLNLAQAQANELLALVNVYQALGGGWQE